MLILAVRADAILQQGLHLLDIVEDDVAEEDFFEAIRAADHWKMRAKQGYFQAKCFIIYKVSLTDIDLVKTEIDLY